MKKAVVFIADGTEEIEVITPVDYLRRAAVQVTLVSVSQSRTVTAAHGVSINADMTLESYLSAGEELPDAVVVPGGAGTKNIAACRTAVDFVTQMDKAGKLVCAICAAPGLVLPLTGALKGKAWTCYPGCEENAGEFVKTRRDEAFVHDANLITGRGPGAAEQFSMEIVRTLTGDAIFTKIKEGSMQR
ncbi:MAG: DJ-1/PfpI family protein [Treponema sp.]|nr:DJ-1/PfpI family protein [Treponema sp.]MBP5575763.1 DJ-1/PfpI family protein [Treponema sp.]